MERLVFNCVRLVMTVLVCICSHATCRERKHGGLSEDNYSKSPTYFKQMEMCSKSKVTAEHSCTVYYDCNTTFHFGTVKGVADCSREGYIPKFSGVVQMLTLRYRFRTIDKLTFSNISQHNLVALDLQYVKIEMISEGAFRKMTNLKYLNMNNNRWLQKASWTEVFSLPALQELSLKRCNLPLQFVAEQVNKTLTLKSLWLSGNSNDMDTAEFEGHELCGKRKNILWFETFSSLTGDLVLADSSIKFMYTRKPMQMLTLDLSNIDLRSFPETCTHGRRSLYESLVNFTIINNRLRTLEHSICLPNLKHLDLSENKITEFYIYFLNSFPTK
jgi:Leucine-rich repeat (LRR) protein